jgi:hypothetical protein
MTVPRHIPPIRIAVLGGLSAVAVMLAVESPAALAGITITPLVTQGDVIPGIGAITAIDSVSVNDNGDWFIECDTDNADTLADAVVLKNGVIAFRENLALDDPAGGNISSFDSVRINASGNAGWNLFLRNLTTTTDSGVFFNDVLIIQESDIATAPQFTAGTPYLGFFEVRMNATNQMLVLTTVDDPAIASTVDRALVLVDYDAKANTHTENVLYKEGDILPGQTEAIADFATGENNSAFNDDGDALFIADLTGDSAVDIALYLNGTLLAQEGSASPVAGRNYLLLTGNPVDLSNNGDWAIRTTLTGDLATDLVIIRNNSLFKSEGDAPPSVGGGVTLTSFGTGPIKINNQGEVTWYGQWTGDTNTNQGLFAGDQLLVQKGVTQINGQTLTTIAGSTATGGITMGFDASPNGRYVIARGLVNATTRVAFLIDRGVLCPGDIAPPGGGGDGQVNIDDLLTVINAWGACDDPCPPCAADLDGNCNVNIDDLLAVINAWGACD